MIIISGDVLNVPSLIVVCKYPALEEWAVDSNKLKVLVKTLAGGTAFGIFALLNGWNPVGWVFGGAVIAGAVMTTHQKEKVKAHYNAHQTRPPCALQISFQCLTNVPLV